MRAGAEFGKLMAVLRRDVRHMAGFVVRGGSQLAGARLFQSVRLERFRCNGILNPAERYRSQPPAAACKGTHPVNLKM